LATVSRARSTTGHSVKTCTTESSAVPQRYIARNVRGYVGAGPGWHLHPGLALALVEGEGVVEETEVKVPGEGGDLFGDGGGVVREAVGALHPVLRNGVGGEPQDPSQLGVQRGGPLGVGPGLPVTADYKKGVDVAAATGRRGLATWKVLQVNVGMLAGGVISEQLPCSVRSVLVRPHRLVEVRIRCYPVPPSHVDPGRFCRGWSRDRNWRLTMCS
jgi:hypothetical protein